MDIQQIADRIREVHGHDAVRHVQSEGPQPWIDLDPDRMGEIALTLRDDDALAFDRLLFVCGIDYEGIDEAGKGKHRAIAQYGEDGRVMDAGPEGTGDLGVSYYAHSMRHRHGLAFKARVPRSAPRVESVCAVWPTANWGERETYDMYGIEFEGHPDLRRILLPEDWVGWPLRKDYAMPDRYHDVPLEGLPLAVRAKQEAPAAPAAPDAPVSGDGGQA